MPNPFFSNKTSPNGATAPNDSLNESSKRYFRGYNKFNLTRQFYNTERYADINVMDVIEGVEGDKLPIMNKHLVRSYTLKSPIMFDIYKKKTYFAVNNLAILPNAWKLIYKQPNKGSDVPDDANSVAHFFSYVKSFLNRDIASLSLKHLIQSILVLESIFSDGSLLASMNCHLSKLIRVSDSSFGKDFDDWLDRVYTRIYSVMTEEEINFTVVVDGLDRDIMFRDSQGFREVLNLLRSVPQWYIPDNAILKTQLVGYISSLYLSYTFRPNSEEDAINVSRLVAYQLICSQFYTRDSVDDIYTAEMYIDNMKGLLNDMLGEVPYFSYNGSKIEYDVFSTRNIDKVFDLFFVSGLGDNVDRAFYYLHSLFFYRKSLRYGDYFTGSKTLPYAPMDVTADVVGSGVSALDITRSIIAQRFANAVERVSNTWKDYLSGITGGVASPNPYEPRFLASSTSSVNGFEVENTADGQFSNNNITTILKSGNSNYVYEVEVSEPCIIIGVSTYEVPRVYSSTISRFFKHTDRFNMFNKFFQNIGDQEISQNERYAPLPYSQTFGYTPRHMEYKQRYPIASGGFVNFLPGYAFLVDNNDSIDLVNDVQISPFYIRNRNTEFDRFYASLTGYSLASYFHFIVKYDLICHASRQMEYSPSIL